MMLSVVFAGLIAVAYATGAAEDGSAVPEPASSGAAQFPAAGGAPSELAAGTSLDDGAAESEAAEAGEAATAEGPLTLDLADAAGRFPSSSDLGSVQGSIQGSFDQVPRGEPVLKLMAMRKLQYLNDANTRHIFAKTSTPAVVKALVRLYDLDKDGVVSIKDWNDFFATILLPYYTKTLGLKKPSADMWSAVSKDGKRVSITGDLFPTLHSMTTEEIFDALAASLFWFYDEDKDGHLNEKELAAFKASPAYLEEKSFPQIKRRPLRLLLAKIESAQKKPAACKIVNRFRDFRRPLHRSIVARFC